MRGHDQTFVSPDIYPSRSDNHAWTCRSASSQYNELTISSSLWRKGGRKTRGPPFLYVSFDLPSFHVHPRRPRHPFPDVEVMVSTQVVVLLATSGVAVVRLTNPVCKSRSVDHWRSQTGTQSPWPQVRVNVSSSQRSQDPHKIQIYI